MDASSAAGGKANQSGLARTPSARVIARLMTSARNDLNRSEAILVAAIEAMFRTWLSPDERLVTSSR